MYKPSKEDINLLSKCSEFTLPAEADRPKCFFLAQLLLMDSRLHSFCGRLVMLYKTNDAGKQSISEFYSGVTNGI